MKIPCKQCPVLAVCISKDYIQCSILDKEVQKGFKSFMEIRSLKIFLGKDYSYRANGGKLKLYTEKGWRQYP